MSVAERLGVAGFLANIASRFGRGSEGAPTGRLDTGYVDPNAFASVVVELVRRDKDKSARLHVFSIGDFRRASGPKWERLGGLVEKAVDGIICRNIDLDKDTFTRLDGEISCLALPRTSRREIRTCVAAIARDLALQLVGDAVIGGRRPQVVAANMPLRSAVTAAGRLDHQAIKDAVNRAGAFLASESAAVAAAEQAALGATLAAPHRDTLASLLAKDDTETREKLAGAGDRQPPALPVFAISGMGGGSQPTDTPDWLDEQLEERAAAALAKPRHMAPETSLTLVWSPIWVSNRQGLGAFQARVIRTDGDGAPPLEGVHAYADAAPIEALTLDRFVATHSARELASMFCGKQRLGLIVPLHWMSLAPRWRDCIRMPFEACSPLVRRKLLKIEVFGLTPALPASILNTLMDPLEMLGCDILARLPLGAAEMVGSLRSVRAIGVDLAELGDEERVGDDELFAKLLEFRDAARQAKTACYVWNVRRSGFVARAIEAGFSLVNGPGVMCDLGHPVLPHVKRKAA